MLCSAAVHAQVDRRIIRNDDFYSNTRFYNYRFKFTAYAFVTGEYGFSLGFSNWITYNRWQPAENFSINAHFGKNNIGNRNTAYNKWQLNVISSFFLTYAFSNNRLENFDEVNPFYFGNSSAIYHNYNHALTIGSSFVALPKGIGRNVQTPRNRSQQLVYLQWKHGGFQFNIYEDYLAFTDNAFFGMLADNRDRYYTGGGNVQLRLNNNFTIKYYTEMYTGNSYMDRDDYPDLVTEDTTKGNYFSYPLGSVGPKRVIKYAYQDPGQEKFNHGRNFLAVQMNTRYLTYDKKTLFNPKYTQDNLLLMFALQRGAAEMWQQNLIHSLIGVDRDLPPDRCGKVKPDRLHFFEPYNPPHKFCDRISIGAALTTDFVVNKIDETLEP